jgi:hypothetical protein
LLYITAIAPHPLSSTSHVTVLLAPPWIVAVVVELKLERSRDPDKSPFNLGTSILAHFVAFCTSAIQAHNLALSYETVSPYPSPNLRVPPGWLLTSRLCS